ncbi:DNA-binding transcription factor [Lithospermum erythrorhizon]|uniref:DNA-binding transcription factor n=1 Tax=Lithospermum erythrorhizon TaxID=34254 RepID=A0AAV3P5I0_LITER
MADNRSLRFGTKKAEAHACKKRKSVEKVVVVNLEINDKRPKSEGPPPSDSWSWRKYGQKPIKGSPFPRGYYKCSTSKGCTAKKQVERCKTDASKLIVTYTSSHNHPITKISKNLEEPSALASEKLQETPELAGELEKEQKPLEKSNESAQLNITMSQFNVTQEGNHLVKKGDVACDSLEVPNAEDENDFYNELDELPTASCLTQLMRSSFFYERILVEPF